MGIYVKDKNGQLKKIAGGLVQLQKQTISPIHASYQNESYEDDEGNVNIYEWYNLPQSMFEKGLEVNQLYLFRFGTRNITNDVSVRIRNPILDAVPYYKTYVMRGDWTPDITGKIYGLMFVWYDGKYLNVKIDKEIDTSELVLKTRTVNGKSLEEDIVLTAEDVGALPKDYVPLIDLGDYKSDEDINITSVTGDLNLTGEHVRISADNDIIHIRAVDRVDILTLNEDISLYSPEGFINLNQRIRIPGYTVDFSAANAAERFNLIDYGYDNFPSVGSDLIGIESVNTRKLYAEGIDITESLYADGGATFGKKVIVNAGIKAKNIEVDGKLELGGSISTLGSITARNIRPTDNEDAEIGGKKLRYKNIYTKDVHVFNKIKFHTDEYSSNPPTITSNGNSIELRLPENKGVVYLTESGFKYGNKQIATQEYVDEHSSEQRYNHHIRLSINFYAANCELVFVLNNSLSTPMLSDLKQLGVIYNTLTGWLYNLGFTGTFDTSSEFVDGVMDTDGYFGPLLNATGNYGDKKIIGIATDNSDNGYLIIQFDDDSSIITRYNSLTTLSYHVYEAII